MTNGDELLSTARVNLSQAVGWEPQTFVQLDYLIPKEHHSNILLDGKEKQQWPKITVADLGSDAKIEKQSTKQ